MLCLIGSETPESTTSCSRCSMNCLSTGVWAISLGVRPSVVRHPNTDGDTFAMRNSTCIIIHTEMKFQYGMGNHTFETDASSAAYSIPLFFHSERRRVQESSHPGLAQPCVTGSVMRGTWAPLRANRRAKVDEMRERANTNGDMEEKGHQN